METLTNPTIASAQSDVMPVVNQQRIEPNPWRPNRKQRWGNGLDWPAVLWIVLVHVCALAAPFFFTWKALGIFLIMSWISGGLGICLGYHRLLAHGSFQTYRFMRRLIAFCGALAGEGPPITWVAVHRKHHLNSDGEGDPHSPHDGAWWSHVLWLFPRPRDPDWQQMMHLYGRDLSQDGFMRMLDKTYLFWHFAVGAVFLFAGWIGWNFYTGMSFLTWGVFLRLVWVMHITWLVNSASHIWGYKNYEINDNSRNLWWVGLLAYGEGWHNNHHAFPSSARHGHRWWEIDVTYMEIRLLERLGLAWHVIRKRKL